MSFEFSGYQQRSERFQQELEAPMEDVLGATAEQAIRESPISSVRRLYELSDAQDSPIRVDAASARQRIKDAGLEGRLTVEDSGIAESALNILMDRKKEEVRRQDILSRAPKGFGSGAKQLGMAFAASALDPINIGLAFVPAVGQARYLRFLAGARGVLGRTAVRAGVGAAEGAVGAAIVEPLIYAAKSQEQADYDMQDSLLNIAFGTVFGGGLHVLGGLAADAGKAVSARKTAKSSIESPARVDEPVTAAVRVEAMPLQEREVALRTAVAQAMQGKAVDVDPLIHAQRQVETLDETMPQGEKATVDSAAQVANVPAAPEVGAPTGLVSAPPLLSRGTSQSNEAVANLPRTASDSIARIDEQLVAIRTEQRALDKEAEKLRLFSDENPVPEKAAAEQRYSRESGRLRTQRKALETIRDQRLTETQVLQASAAADRQASPESEVTADVPAAQSADRQLAEVKTALDPIAEQEALLADELAQLKEQAKVMEFDLGDELAEFDEAIQMATLYGKAARTAALCGMAH